MATTVKEFLRENGVRKDVALELDEITLSMHTRIVKFRKTSVEKSQIMMDVGRYRHIEAKAPMNLMEMHRINLDLALFVARFDERLRMLENYDIIRFNFQTGDYEFTELGNQLFQPAQ